MFPPCSTVQFNSVRTIWERYTHYRCFFTGDLTITWCVGVAWPRQLRIYWDIIETQYSLSWQRNKMKNEDIQLLLLFLVVIWLSITQSRQTPFEKRLHVHEKSPTNLTMGKDCALFLMVWYSASTHTASLIISIYYCMLENMLIKDFTLGQRSWMPKYCKHLFLHRLFNMGSIDQ